jgi:hypothetical protein
LHQCENCDEAQRKNCHETHHISLQIGGTAGIGIAAAIERIE